MADLPFSEFRRVGSTVYLSGEVGFAADGTMPEDITTQTQNCLNNIKATLEKAGLGLENVVSCTCYLTDRRDFAAFNAAYAPFFQEPRPVRSTVEAALMIPGKLEITVIAHD